MRAPPDASTLTKIFTGSATAVTDRGTLYVTDPGGNTGTHRQLVLASAPSVAYTFTVRLNYEIFPTFFTNVGIVLAGTGVNPSFLDQVLYFNGTAAHVATERWNDQATENLNTSDVALGLSQLDFWFQVQDDLTNLTWRWGPGPRADGTLPFTSFTEGRTAFLGSAPTRLGIVFSSQSGTVANSAGGRIDHWLVTTP